MESKTKILVVDDDQGMTETLSDILTDVGYQVAVAGDGYQAIDMIKKDSYDIALMDIKMPGINGVDTFKQIKEMRPATKVIMMTAYSVENLIEQALSNGAYGVLYKPLDLKKVVAYIKQAKKGSFILLVDDDPASCETLKDILKETGHKVAIAHSGKEALDYAKKNNLEIVFIDMKMPVLNGLDTYKALKKINPNITAILITGYRQETSELVKQALDSSAYVCLYKPLDVHKIVSIVNEISRQRIDGVVKKTHMEI